MKKTILQLDHVYKWYRLHHEKPTLVERIITNNKERFCAVNDINISICRGEKVGITGPNGSGKTTLLKLIAGITAPSNGSIRRFGSVASLIEIGAGFHPDLSGYHNIFLNGLMLGMSREYIQRKFNAIVQFAGIRQFIDIPLFTYSEGMKFRLGFSVAIFANADVLVLDEGFAVADAAFSEKIQKQIQLLRKGNKTIIMASHNQQLLKGFCSKIIALQEGTIMKTSILRRDSLQ